MSRHCKTLGQTTPAAGVCRLFRPLFASILYAVLALALQAWPAWAEAQNAITGLDFSMLPGDRVQIVVTASGPLAEPRSFSTDNPARIAIDFDNTANQLPSRNVGGAGGRGT